MRHKPTEREYVLAALQAALDLAHARIRALEAAGEWMAERLTFQTARADHYELLALELREEEETLRRMVGALRRSAV